MAYQVPIFTKGLYAGANRHVMQGMADASRTVSASQQGLAKARQLVVGGNVARLGLCSLSQATLITANRWKYQVEAFYPPSLAGGGIAAPNCSSFDYLEVLNLREYFNTATVVDGMDITTPASTVGPVGSVWNGAAWPTTSLAAVVNVYVVYALDGTAWPYFDRPNPVRCTEAAGGGE